MYIVCTIGRRDVRKVLARKPERKEYSGNVVVDGVIIQ
jgi:preprotein translocase subunit Sss1